MARPKKIDPFDFKSTFPNLGNAHAVLKEKYSEDELYAKAAEFIKQDRLKNPGSHYWLWPKIEAVTNGTADRTAAINAYDWSSLLEVIIHNGDPAIEEHHAKFVEWYDANTVAQELYKAVAPNAWSFRDEKNGYVNGHHYISAGNDANHAKPYREHPRNAFNFANIAYGEEGRKYAESHREQKFQEGDIVVLRAPFVGNHRYDPHWRNNDMKTDDLRYGTVMLADTDKFNRRSRGGKGSRLINVMWMGTEDAETVAVPERCLKWESRKRSS